MRKRTARSKLRIIPATHSMAQVEKMLRSARRQPLLPPGVLDKVIEENKRDVYEKWTAARACGLTVHP